MKAQAITAAATAAFIYLIPPETGEQHPDAFTELPDKQEVVTLVSRNEAGLTTDFWPENSYGVTRHGATLGTLILERSEKIGREFDVQDTERPSTGLRDREPVAGQLISQAVYERRAMRTMSAELDEAGGPASTFIQPPTELVAAETAIVSDNGSVWVKDAPLNEVFQYLAQEGDYQFFHNAELASPEYLVTGHLKEGDPMAQMEELGLMYGITVYRKGQTVYAMTQVQLTQLPRKPLQYNLKYLRPTDIDQIKNILQPVLTPGSGSIDYETKTNTLIVYDNEQKTEAILEILAVMDKPKQQIAIETRILRVKTGSSNRIGVDWSSVLGEGLTFEAGASLNNLFNLPDSDTVSQVVTLTREAANAAEDILGSNVLGSFDESPTLSNGLSTSLLGGAFSGTGASSSGVFDDLTEATTSSLFGGGFGESSTRNNSFSRVDAQNVTRSGSSLVLSPLQIQAVLRALSAGNLAQQESSPTLITEDNEEGLISIIDRVPLIFATISETDVGQNITEEVRYRIDADDPVNDPAETREVGVTVSVTPTLLPDNTVRMLLRPRSAQIVEFIQGQTGNLYPRVNESTIQTIARVPNGHSLLIGGVYQEIEDEVTNKVPFLGDVPGMNFMFKSVEKMKEHTSLVFVVTPTTYEPVSIPENSAMLRQMHDLHVLPANYADADRKSPGSNYESRPFRSIGNALNLIPDDKPTNHLHPDHSMHDMEMSDQVYHDTLRARSEPVSKSRKKKKGGLFSRDR